jgi:lipoprotein-releasing system ATP-binding protein
VFAQDEERLAAFRNREIGFVFQFHQLLPDFTALENVMLPALIARESSADARPRA